MRHYHGTPVGGTRQDAAKFLQGRDALVSFAYPDDVAIVAEVCKSFIFDNGAFTVWKKGGVLDIPGYIAWCLVWERHPGFEWALIPDVIDGNEADNDALLLDWPASLRGVPVWHLHESLDRLERLVHTYDVVALGSSGQWATPGTEDWWIRMSEAMNVACDIHGRPYARLHGLRMLNPKVFMHLPLSSGDSTNATVNGGSLSRFGMYPAPTRAQRSAVIAARIEQVNSAPVWIDGTWRC